MSELIHDTCQLWEPLQGYDHEALEEIGESIVVARTARQGYSYATVREMTRRLICVLACIHEELHPPVDNVIRQLYLDLPMCVLFAGWSHTSPILDLQPPQPVVVHRPPLLRSHG